MGQKIPSPSSWWSYTNSGDKDGYSGYVADVSYSGEAKYDLHAPAY